MASRLDLRLFVLQHVRPMRFLVAQVVRRVVSLRLIGCIAALNLERNASPGYTCVIFAGNGRFWYESQDGSNHLAQIANPMHAQKSIEASPSKA